MTDDLVRLLTEAAQVGARHRETVATRPVHPANDLPALAAAFGGDLPAGRTPPDQVVTQLVAAATPGLVGTVGPRFFGFVIGGSSPSATAADILAAGWDQCAYNEVLPPSAAAAERAAGTWAKQLLGLPANASVGFVTGAQAANTVGLAVGRHRVLADAGWDVERDGLFGAPRVAVVASEERHATIDRAARLLGLGTAAIHPVAATAEGAIDVDALGHSLEALAGQPVIVCLQAGNVNTGACDGLRRSIALARRHGAWVHVDGAFGLWAAASPRTAHLVDGVEDADSWGTDAHKWLNVPYDSGLAFCADAALHAATMSYAASYLTGSGAGSDFVLGDLTPESSRRARGFAVWAALRELGTEGVAELVDPVLCPDPQHGRPAAVWWSDSAQRGRAQPAPREPRRPPAHRRGHRGGAARRHVLGRWHDVARPAAHPHLGLQRDHHRGRHRTLRRRHPPGSRGGQRRGSGVDVTGSAKDG